MKGYLIQGPIDPQVVEEVLQKKNEILDLLKPYTIRLTEDEKLFIPKAADETLPFLEKGIKYAKTDPDYLPRKVEEEELDNDYIRFNAANSMERVGNQIMSVLNDLSIASGSDLYVTLLSYYRNVQAEAELGDSRAKAIAEDLGKMFKDRKRGTNTEVIT